MRGFHSFLVIKSDVKITGTLPLIHCTPNNDIVYEKMIVYEVCSFGCGMTSPYLAAVITALAVTDECIKKLACALVGQNPTAVLISLCVLTSVDNIHRS